MWAFLTLFEKFCSEYHFPAFDDSRVVCAADIFKDITSFDISSAFYFEIFDGLNGIAILEFIAMAVGGFDVIFQCFGG